MNFVLINNRAGSFETLASNMWPIDWYIFIWSVFIAYAGSVLLLDFALPWQRSSIRCHFITLPDISRYSTQYVNDNGGNFTSHRLPLCRANRKAVWVSVWYIKKTKYSRIHIYKDIGIIFSLYLFIIASLIKYTFCSNSCFWRVTYFSRQCKILCADIDHLFN